MKRIYTAKNPIDAHLLKGVLETQDIQTEVKGDFMWSFLGELPVSPDFLPNVWVINDEDYEKAMEIVSDFESKEMSSPEVEEWKCAKCNEINEGQFTECWQCGASRNAEN
jgi:hypothetical protein